MADPLASWKRSLHDTSEVGIASWMSDSLGKILPPEEVKEEQVKCALSIFRSLIAALRVYHEIQGIPEDDIQCVVPCLIEKHEKELRVNSYKKMIGRDELSPLEELIIDLCVHQNITFKRLIDSVEERGIEPDDES